MIKTNKTLTYLDLVRPLSLEALEYFASREIPVSSERDSTLSGKFVRVGEVMLIGTTISYGAREYHSGLQKSLKHYQLLNYLEAREPELMAKAEASLGHEPLVGKMLHDAGMTNIRTDEQGQLLRLDIFGGSYDFDRADAEGRVRTIMVAQELVGDSITIRNLVL